MGGFVVMDIGFVTLKDRMKFEEKYKIKNKDILVGEKVKCSGMAWTYLRNPSLDIIYNMGFMGYGDPKIILKECLTGRNLENDENLEEYWTKPKKKDIIKIKFLAFNPINDRNATWTKLRGRW